ncbi:MAG: T9SS type A sorting domain-containing protein [Flavobacteriales bacterium]
MKKPILALAFILSAALSHAQIRIVAVSNGTDVSNGNYEATNLTLNQEKAFSFYVINDGDFDINIHPEKTSVSAPNGWGMNYCLDQCWFETPPQSYSYSIYAHDTATHQLKINVTASGSTNMDFASVVTIKDKADPDNKTFVRVWVNSLTAGSEVIKANDVNMLFSPNPSTGLVNIAYSLGTSPNGKILVRDLTGRTILTQSVAQSSSNVAMDLSAQPAGIYLVSLVAGGQTVTTQKLILK